jgi:ribosomal protein S4E
VQQVESVYKEAQNKKALKIMKQCIFHGVNRCLLCSIGKNVKLIDTSSFEEDNTVTVHYSSGEQALYLLGKKNWIKKRDKTFIAISSIM